MNIISMSENGLVSQSVDAFARPIGEAAVEYGIGSITGAVTGKAISWGVGRIATKIVPKTNVINAANNAKKMVR